MPLSDSLPLCGNVIYQNSEDNVADTITPRLIDTGADCSKIAFIDNSKDDTPIDQKAIEAAIIEIGAKLLVLDPLQAYIGKDADLVAQAICAAL